MNTYLIVSETIYYINKKLQELKGNIDNVIIFNLDENTIDEVLEEASYFSMFDDNKCIIVKNAKFFGQEKKEDSKGKNCADKLLKYLENENKNTRLIFINNKVDTRKKIYNILKDSNNVFNYPNLTKTEIKNELNKIVLENKYKIDDKSLWYIINSSLGNFDLAINEIKKIMIYYSKPCLIKYEDVCNLTVNTLEENNFKLVDSIINRDLSLSLKYLNELKILKIDASAIISLLYREFKLMLLVSIYEKNKINSSEILKKLKIADWQYQKIKKNMYNYNLREIKEEIVNLSNIDYKYKSGLINKDLVLINYIMRTCE